METPDTITAKRGQAFAKAPVVTLFVQFIVPILCSAVLTGCSVEKTPGGGFSSPARSVDSGGGSPVQIKEAPIQRSTSDIEIIFEPPQGDSDGIIVKYGARADSLNFSQKFPKDAWVKVASSAPGLSTEVEKFRCLIRDIPSSQTLFISLAAYSGETISAFTDPVEIK